MEAVVERVVGWLQRAALWLAGKTMLLQTRTIRNKDYEDGRLNPVFCSTDPTAVGAARSPKDWGAGAFRSCCFATKAIKPM
jgi:hypothetical protein